MMRRGEARRQIEGQHWTVGRLRELLAQADTEGFCKINKTLPRSEFVEIFDGLKSWDLPDDHVIGPRDHLHKLLAATNILHELA